VDEAGTPKSEPLVPNLSSPSPEPPSDAEVERGVSAAESPAPTSVAAPQGARLASRMRVGLAIAGGAALVGAVAVLIAIGADQRAPRRATAAPIAGSVAGGDLFVDGPPEVPLAVGSRLDEGGALPPADGPPEGGTGRPPVWRVAQLGDDAGVALVDGVIGHRPMLVAFEAAGISAGEAARVARSLSEVRSADRLGPKDTFIVAREKADGHVVAYEVASSPIDVWQGREQAQIDGSMKLVPRKIELVPESLRVRKAVLVGSDLRASLAEAGLGPVDQVLTMIDDALEGHAELSDIRPGARLRIVATQELLDGALVRLVSLDAVEYFPATPNAPSVRVYYFGDDEGPKKHHGWYDTKGRQPIRGGWRMPVPLARIASRFNPRRMHPVLHVIMPHNGVDLAAPAGAPVYATAAGVVASAGFDGPCGNKVEIEHPNGMTSIYCHLSRFAAGLRVGQHVEQRQLIAYVGQTGRVTGPHLHFGIRRGDVFIDPLTLRLDGVRVVPRTRRDEFDRLRALLDADLDATPLPATAGLSPDAPEPETFYEEGP
jgi:murein DD-endopeptidase MepM/ murein hydrolase activator NlpD